MGFLDSIFGDGGKAAANAAREGSNLALAGQQRGLDYLQDTGQSSFDAREQGLQGLMGLFGDNPEFQQNLIQKMMNSPLYKQIIGNRSQGEESIMRNAAATGGLRSGNVQENLYDYNTQLENQALLESYNQELGGLRGLAGTGTNENVIAQLMADMGMTQAQGVQGAAQAREQGRAGRFKNLLGIGKLGLTAAGVGGFSDIRLKENIFPAGSINGHHWYAWTWRPEAEKLGLKGPGEGVMAHEVMKYMPDAIGEQDGYITVDYEKLGVI